MEKSILIGKLKNALLKCIEDKAQNKDKHLISKVMAVTEPDGVTHENHQYGWLIDDIFPDQIWLVVKSDKRLDVWAQPKMLAIFSAYNNSIDEIVETASTLIETKRR